MPTPSDVYTSKLTREELCKRYCEGLTDEWLSFYYNTGCTAKWVWDELQKERYGTWKN